MSSLSYLRQIFAGGSIVSHAYVTGEIAGDLQAKTTRRQFLEHDGLQQHV